MMKILEMYFKGKNFICTYRKILNDKNWENIAVKCWISSTPALPSNGQNANRTQHNLMLCCLVKHHFLRTNHWQEEQEMGSVVRFCFCYSSPALTRNRANLLDWYLLPKLVIYCLRYISGKNPKNELRILLFYVPTSD